MEYISTDIDIFISSIGEIVSVKQLQALHCL
jgi:hypothetical protein